MPVRFHRDGFIPGLILKGLETFGVVTANCQIIDAKDQASAQGHREVDAIGDDAVAAEHAAQTDRTKFGEEIDEIIMVHRSAADQPSIFAGINCTDSPHPQALTSLGLLKTNWACILSAL